MDMSTSLNGLGSLLGISSTSSSVSQTQSGTAASGNALDGDQATFSSVGNGFSQMTSGDDVRADKVASIQSALAAGTYSVPSSAVASSMIDSMLSGGR